MIKNDGAIKVCHIKHFCLLKCSIKSRDYFAGVLDHSVKKLYERREKKPTPSTPASESLLIWLKYA